MAPSSRDRISVDLHGLKAALFERAQALGVSPSGLVRTNSKSTELSTSLVTSAWKNCGVAAPHSLVNWMAPCCRLPLACPVAMSRGEVTS